MIEPRGVNILTDDALNIARGTSNGNQSIQKFGANPDVAASTEEDLWIAGGLYTGWLTAASAIRIKAGGNAADDDDGGAGARKVMVEGLDENWEVASEELTAAGADASSASTVTFIRVSQAYVTDAGTYGGVNTGNVDIETTGGTLVARIGLKDLTATGLGQTQLAMYTVPSGKTAYIRRISYEVEGTKEVDIYFWQRQNADDTSAPFTAKRAWHALFKVTGSSAGDEFKSLLGPFPAKTDIWVSAVGPNGGAAVAADFDIVLVDAG